MAKKKATAAAEAVPGDEPRMHSVRVTRVVEVKGFRYKPGHAHTVDDATLAALEAAEAVADGSAS